VDLALLAAREAAREHLVERGHARRERPQPVVLAAQRRRVGLQPPLLQQRLENALALADVGTIDGLDFHR
jgi:hypothetical protein